MLQGLRLNSSADEFHDDNPDEIAKLLSQSSPVESKENLSTTVEWDSLNLLAIPEAIHIQNQSLMSAQTDEMRQHFTSNIESGYLAIQKHVETINTKLLSEEASEDLNIHDVHESVSVISSKFNLFGLQTPEGIVKLKEQLIERIENSLESTNVEFDADKEEIVIDITKSTESDFDSAEEITLDDSATSQTTQDISTNEIQDQVATDETIEELETALNAQILAIKECIIETDSIDASEASIDKYQSSFNQYKEFSKFKYLEDLNEEQKHLYSEQLDLLALSNAQLQQNCQANVIYSLLKTHKTGDEKAKETALGLLNKYHATVNSIQSPTDHLSSALIELNSLINPPIIQSNSANDLIQNPSTVQHETTQETVDDTNESTEVSECGIAKGSNHVPLYSGKTTLSATSSAVVNSAHLAIVKKSLGFNVHRGCDTHNVVKENNELLTKVLIHKTLRGLTIHEHEHAYEFTSGHYKLAAKTAISLAKHRGWNQVTAWGSTAYMTKLSQIGQKHGIDVIPIDKKLVVKMADYKNIPFQPVQVPVTRTLGNSEKTKPITSDLKGQLENSSANEKVVKSSISVTPKSDSLSDHLAEHSKNNATAPSPRV